MGKYKQWLHHQEVGRRLRDQIATLEQERERVQKMAPPHPTTLPELDNPVIAALLTYTRQGNPLGGSSSSALPSFGGSSSSAPISTPLSASMSGAELPAMAGMPAGESSSAGNAAAGADGTDPVGGWWQRYKPDDQA